MSEVRRENGPLTTDVSIEVNEFEAKGFKSVQFNLLQ